ncbi:MAG: hypothetical protein AB7S38_33940 [Vulcanimicrobiota bacterium]
MPYISSIEQMGIQKGLEQGLKQGHQSGQLDEARHTVVSLLAARFGQTPPGLEESLAAQQDLAELRRLALRAAQVARLEDF